MEIIKYPAPTAGRLIVFLHGFPSLRSKQNREIASGVVAATGRPADLLLYSGLGFAPGTFSFSGCLDEVTRYFDGLLGAIGLPDQKVQTNQVDIVGHSWGGFLALMMAKRHGPRIRKLALMSPLLAFGTEKDARANFMGLTQSAPQLTLAEPDFLLSDFLGMGNRYPPQTLIEEIPTSIDVLLLQAKLDELTPASIAIGMKDVFRKPPDFELVDNDHGFLQDRAAVANRIGRFLGSL